MCRICNQLLNVPATGQYADDTTLLLHSRPQPLRECVTEMNEAVSRLSNYSVDSYLHGLKLFKDQVDEVYYQEYVAIALTPGTYIVQISIAEGSRYTVFGNV